MKLFNKERTKQGNDVQQAFKDYLGSGHPKSLQQEATVTIESSVDEG
jgi:hypothetical protein